MVMQLKESDYNFIYDDLGKDQVVFYNSRTGALAVVHEAQYQQFKAFRETGKEIEDTEFLNNLLKCGYLLPAGVDEKFLIKTNLMLGRYNKSLLSLTIAPTMACNFRCIYCFEQGHYGNRLMDQATQDHLMEFIEKHLGGVKYLSVAWFGGEPLVGMPVIESLSQRIIALCKEKDVQYSASIITNGYLLTKEVAEKLKEYHVRSAQITVDGPKEIHDTRRPMANGQGTYDVIMEHLVETKGILPINLRINVDYDNVAAADQVVETLREKDLLQSVHPYLGLVTTQNDVYEPEKCLSNEQYSKINLDFLLRQQIPLGSMYPMPKKNACTADFYNGWVIDDTGALYKCWNDIGIPEKSVGNINTPDNYIYRTDLIDAYSAFDWKLYPECEACKMLPTCLGGCPNKRLDGNVECNHIKFGMQEYLVRCTEAFLSRTRQASKAPV